MEPESEPAVQIDPLEAYSTEERVALYDKNVRDEDCNVYCMNNVLWGKLLTEEVVRGSSVLVLPCGTGRNVRQLAKLGASGGVATFHHNMGWGGGHCRGARGVCPGSSPPEQLTAVLPRRSG